MAAAKAAPLAAGIRLRPWGKPTKGAKTRKNKQTDKLHPSFASCEEEEKIGRRSNTIMPRSVWKGPFVDRYLLKKMQKRAQGGKHKGGVKTWSRRSTISAAIRWSDF